ncbi:MAG: hypothetical protein HXN43_03800 [Prevotella micans]|nr:hypothetical protein [Prevotella micans]
MEFLYGIASINQNLGGDGKTTEQAQNIVMPLIDRGAMGVENRPGGPSLHASYHPNWHKIIRGPAERILNPPTFCYIPTLLISSDSSSFENILLGIAAAIGRISVNQ